MTGKRYTKYNAINFLLCEFLFENILGCIAGKIILLTYPSGCNLIRYFFLLKLNFRIFAQENVLILVKFWKTSTPMCATARFNGTPSWSWKKTCFILIIFMLELVGFSQIQILGIRYDSFCSALYTYLCRVHFGSIEFTPSCRFQ